MKKDFPNGLFHYYPCSKTRLESITDGVIAIVLTLLVFNLSLSKERKHLNEVLVEMWPDFLSFGISFVLVGIYWNAHHAIFHYIHRSNIVFTWLNFHFLCWLSLIPFSTRVMALYDDDPLALSLYGGNLICIGLSLAIIWNYASSKHRLIDEGLSPKIINYAKARCWFGPIGYTVALSVVKINPRITLIVFVIIPILYILPQSQIIWLRIFGLTHDESESIQGLYRDGEAEPTIVETVSDIR